MLLICVTAPRSPNRSDPVPDGWLVHLGSSSLDRSGLRFAGNLRGSESTLGIATKIALRIVKKPNAIRFREQISSSNTYCIYMCFCRRTQFDLIKAESVTLRGDQVARFLA
jgi:hypothetical protein